MTFRRMIAVAAAVLALLAAAGGARAEVLPAVPKPALTMTMTGTLTYVKNLETPHYELGGMALVAPDHAVLALLAGQEVTVTGRPFNGVSLLMRRQFLVQELTAVLEGDLQTTDGQYELNGWVIRGLEGQVQALEGARVRLVGSVVWRSKGPPTMQALGLIPLSQRTTREVTGHLKQEDELTYSVGNWLLQHPHPQWLKLLTGQVVTVTGQEAAANSRPTLKVTELKVSLTGLMTEITDLEAPHYQLNGFVLSGLTGDVQAYSGKPVTVYGSLSQGVSIYMRPVLKVISVSEAAAPGKVRVDGSAVKLPVPAALKDGRLVLPLRAVIEAAGGQVTWDPALWAVRVRVGARATTIRIGSINAGGTALSQAPHLQNGHTMAPADLFELVGLELRWTGAELNLVRSE